MKNTLFKNIKFNQLVSVLALLAVLSLYFEHSYHNETNAKISEQPFCKVCQNHFDTPSDAQLFAAIVDAKSYQDIPSTPLAVVVKPDVVLPALRAPPA